MKSFQLWRAQVNLAIAQHWLSKARLDDFPANTMKMENRVLSALSWLWDEQERCHLAGGVVEAQEPQWKPGMNPSEQFLCTMQLQGLIS